MKYLCALAVSAALAIGPMSGVNPAQAATADALQSPMSKIYLLNHTSIQLPVVATANNKVVSAKISYKSSNKKVLSVSSKGLLKAGSIKKTTKVTITAKSGKVTKKFTVYVVKKRANVKASVKVPSTIAVGETKWATASAGKGTNATMNFTSGQKAYLTADKYGKLTGLKAGKIKLTVRVRTTKIVKYVNVVPAADPFADEASAGIYDGINRYRALLGLSPIQSSSAAMMQFAIGTAAGHSSLKKSGPTVRVHRGLCEAGHNIQNLNTFNKKADHYEFSEYIKTSDLKKYGTNYGKAFFEDLLAQLAKEIEGDTGDPSVGATHNYALDSFQNFMAPGNIADLAVTMRDAGDGYYQIGIAFSNKTVATQDKRNIIWATASETVPQL